MKRKKRAFVLVEVILAISLVTGVLFYLIQQLRDEYLQKIEALCVPELERIAHNHLAEVVVQMMENRSLTWEKLMVKEPPLAFSTNICIPLSPNIKMTFVEKVGLKPVYKTSDTKNCIAISLTYSSLVNKKSYIFDYMQFVEKIPSHATAPETNEKK